MTTVHDDLVELERSFWYADAGFYAQHLAEEALLVFPSPVGVLDRAATLEGIAAGPRWSEVRMSDVRSRPLGEDAVGLVYAASARRKGDDRPYEALATSVYVLRDGRWRLTLHQQSPSTS